MTRRLHELDDRDLTTALIAAGRTLPAARRDVVDAVGTALRSTTSSPPSRGRVSGRRRTVVAMAVLLVALGGAAIAAGIVPGVDLRRGEVGTLRGPSLAGDAAFLGRHTTLPAAQERAGFAVLVPQDRSLGQPQVYLARRDDRTRVSLLYPADEAMPAIGGTSAGLLVTQFRGSVDPVLLQKLVGADVRVAAVDVGGAPGWWIGGAHEVLYVDDTGDVTTERVRYARRTLLWSVDGVTLRLEADVPRERAVRIAAGMR